MRGSGHRDARLGALGTLASPQGPLSTGRLIDALALMGGAADRVWIWVMHSTVFGNLRGQISPNIDGVSNFAIVQATPRSH